MITPTLSPGGNVNPPGSFELKAVAYDSASLGTFTFRVTGVSGPPSAKTIHYVDIPLTIKPFYLLRVHAILTALNDGSELANISNQEIQTMLDSANQVYTLAGIRFIFDPSDREVVKQTNLKQDLPYGKEEGGGLMPGFSQVRTDYANNYPHRIVIYFRLGKDSDPHYVPANFSSSSGNYIVLAPEPPNNPAFMHEVGHYLGLNHPFGAYHDKIWSQPNSQNPTLDARRNYVIALIKSIVDDHHDSDGNTIQKSAADVLTIFDGDGLADTPSDEPALFGESLSTNWEATAPTSFEFDVNLNSGSVHYVIKPDQGNVMSYYFRGPRPQHVSNDQATIVNNILGLGGTRHSLII